MTSSPKTNANEHLVTLPAIRRGETCGQYRERVRAWEDKRLRRFQVKGIYRPIPVLTGLTSNARSLLVTLSWISWSLGTEGYGPIRVTSRAIAALLGCSQSDASRDLRRLIQTGALEIVEPPAGRRAGTYRVVIRRGERRTEATNETEPIPDQREKHVHHSIGDDRDAPASHRDYVDPRRDAVIAEIRRRFDGAISTTTILGLCDEFCVEEVERQVRWFRHRDIRGFRNGAAAAFVTFVRDRSPEPSEVTSIRAAAEERRRQEQARIEHEAAQETQNETFERRLAELTEDEIDTINRNVRAQVAGLGVAEDGAAFRGMVRAETLRRVGDPQSREACHVG